VLQPCSGTGSYQEAALDYSHGDSWDRMLRQGIQLLERLAQDNRIVVAHPRQNLQVKLVRPLSNGNDFVSYIDGIGMLDGGRCLLEWKTTTARYPEEPEGLLALDPQLICYSWMSGIADYAVRDVPRSDTPKGQCQNFIWVSFPRRSIFLARHIRTKRDSACGRIRTPDPLLRR
jgi:hypothetical protein